MLRWRMLIGTSLALLSGCGLIDAGSDPVIEAHRGATGYWPQNSRSAVYGSVAESFDAIEIDLVLTADLVPVLSHDPWVHEELCTTSSGEVLTSRTLISSLTLAELTADFVCGGIADPDHPNAEVLPETVMTFDEMLIALEDAPSMIVHLDVKYEPGMTAEPADFASEILGRWQASALDNPYYVTANLPELLSAFDALQDVETSLIYPRFPPDSNSTLIALGTQFRHAMGVEELTAVARSAGADGIAIPFQLADRRALETARREGLKVQLWTINDPAHLDRYAKWPVDALITDYPLDAGL